MTNGGLLRAGNAALAMNLAGQHSRLVWFAPQHVEGGSSAKGKIFDLIPENVTWMIIQLWLTVALIAMWKGRRIGPLVAEDLPVVVRASETVEGRGRLYRSRRARDRAAAGAAHRDTAAPAAPTRPRRRRPTVRGGAGDRGAPQVRSGDGAAHPVWPAPSYRRRLGTAHSCTR